jgi:CBS domain-containing protein
MNHLLEDLRALERMEAEGQLELGTRHIGAEQELFLVDDSFRPAPKAMEVIARIRDPHYVHELASFNLEINLDPVPWGADCFQRLHRRLDEHLDRLRHVAEACGVEPVLAGILPTIRRSDLGVEWMTPRDRYAALNEAFMRLRDPEHRIHIKGLDEISVVCNSVMIEACNASWQVHYQVGAREFANLYNVSQLALGPMLAAAVNAPMLFGRRLWHETRVAVFQQAVDTRPSSRDPMDRMARVSFGRQWVEQSVLEIYREDVARFRALVGAAATEEPLAVLDHGGVPHLRALQLHNSTVYRWNRPCYGVHEGRAHLRIENRILPSGPSSLDEIANAVFWFGLLLSLSREHADVAAEFDFSDARGNFLAAAHHGLGAHFSWFEGRTHPARQLLCDELLPGARAALLAAGIDRADVERYLRVIDERVRSGRTGSDWVLRSVATFPESASRGTCAEALVAATIDRQKSAAPVADWPLARIEEAGPWQPRLHRVEDFMSTDLYIVGPDEPANLVASMMVWKSIRHVPVEDGERRLVGIISYRRLVRCVAECADPRALSASAIMKPDPVTVTPETPALEAIQCMERENIDCLPVVRQGRLVGILTDRDFMAIARQMLRDSLRKPGT